MSYKTFNVFESIAFSEFLDAWIILFLIKRSHFMLVWVPFDDDPFVLVSSLKAFGFCHEKSLWTWEKFELKIFHEVSSF